MPKLKLKISKSGEITYIYNDLLAGLAQNNGASIRRVSHVEPTADGKWEAQMLDFNVTLGPFRLRSEALEAEMQFLDEKLFGMKGMENGKNENDTTQTHP